MRNDIKKEGIEGFDWAAYEDCWDGTGFNFYNKPYINDENHAAYSHDEYIANDAKAYKSGKIPQSKELKKDTLVDVTDFVVCSDGNSVLATINGGANNVIIDLSKEARFFNTIALGNGEEMTKEKFVECIKNPDMKKKLLSFDIKGKVGTDTEKASMWDGHVEHTSNEMRESIYKNDKAYIAKILSSNNGGFVVEIMNTVKAFMPGSMASANRLFNYDSLVGSDMEVMVESYDNRTGFVVSRKKYLHTIIPSQIKALKGELKENKDALYHGTVTDTKPFGIFVEMDGFGGCLTGMIHKTLMDDSLRNALRDRTVKSGDRLDIYVHKIEKMKDEDRIIFSNVPSNERAAVIQKREAEDAQEKNTYVSNRRDSRPKQHRERVASELSEAEINMRIEEKA